MSDLNTVFLQGRLTKDASLNTLSNGGAVVTLSLAVNKDWQDRQTGDWKKTTSFFDVSYWGERARHNLAEYTKGREVLVEGELRVSSWEADGKKHSRVEVRAGKVQALRRPCEGKRLGSETATPAQPAAVPDFAAAPAADDYPDGIPF